MERIILAVSPQEMNQGTPPDPEVDGYFGGVRFEEGVSEVVDYATALRFAARGNAALPPEEAREWLDEVRGETRVPSDEEGEQPEEDVALAAPNVTQEITPATLDERAIPEEVDVPGYNAMRSFLADEGVPVQDFFGRIPEKDVLAKLYVAATDGLDALK